jgi:hypothetical protein
LTLLLRDCDMSPLSTTDLNDAVFFEGSKSFFWLVSRNLGLREVR